MRTTPTIPPRPTRRLAAAALGLALAASGAAATTFAAAPVAHAAPSPSPSPTPTPAASKYRSPVFEQRQHARVEQAPAMVGAAAATSDTPAAALATINGHRSRYRVPALALDTSVAAALDAHAKYVSLNLATDSDVSTEEQGNPGWTQAGADIAPYATGTSSATLSGAVQAWLSDPYDRDVELLDQTAASIGFGSYTPASGTPIRLYAIAYTGDAPTGYPRTFPAGANFTELRNGAPWLADDYGCSGSGYPVTAMWDYASYGAVTATSGQLHADGKAVAACVVPPQYLSAGEAALVPASALSAGTHYTGQLTVTVAVRSGGTKTLTQPIDFTTAAAATSVAGDQTGDRVADVFTTTASGDLMLYKGTAAGRLGHGWTVGSGWGAFDWMQLAGDVNGDGRSDLLARRHSDGAMLLYQSLGMGGFRAGVTVGSGWGGLSAITVVGDMNHDGTRDIVARNAANQLLSYRLGATSITGGTTIGSGWGGMRYLVGAGSMNGDAYDDIVAIRADGNLYVYYGGPKNTITGSRQVGHGWTGYTALFTPGDLNGDGRLDLVGRNALGELYAYRNAGSSWVGLGRAGTGFGGMSLLA